MDIKGLEKKAYELRLDILETINKASKGHIGGAFSCIEILVALYYTGFLYFDPSCPQMENRDRFILSKGHVGIALYAVLADLGFFDKAELDLFNKGGGKLGEHPDRRTPGIEIDSGSLGHGLGIGAGMALAAKLDSKKYKTVVLLGDGECYEGSIWEAGLFAAHHKLNNLIAIIDRNKLIVNDFTENINHLEPLKEKWSSFGWNVKEVDGHSISSLLDVYQSFAYEKENKPCMVIANTVKGKGVKFMEGVAAWHHGVLAGEKLGKARQELAEVVNHFNH